MAQHNLNNIVVDRVLRGVFSDKNDNIIFSLNQIQDLSLNQTSESQEITDALGVSIMELMRAKSLEASANNAIYDFGLLAAQYGTEKIVANDGIVMVEETFVTDESGIYTLEHYPRTKPTFVFAKNDDGSLGEQHYVTINDSDGVFEIVYADMMDDPVFADGSEFVVVYGYVSESDAQKIVVPAMETFEVYGVGIDGIGAYDLKHNPIKMPTVIYELNGDSTLGAKHSLSVDTSGSSDAFTYFDGCIWAPAGKEYFVMYEYESDSAIEVVNSADKFAKMGKMTFEVLVYDVCDPETKMFAYLILPRFQLSNDFDWTIGGDNQQHAFSGKAMVDYCAKDKKMVRVVIVDDEEDE